MFLISDRQMELCIRFIEVMCENIPTGSVRNANTKRLAGKLLKQLRAKQQVLKPTTPKK